MFTRSFETYERSVTHTPVLVSAESERVAVHDIDISPHPKLEGLTCSVTCIRFLPSFSLAVHRGHHGSKASMEPRGSGWRKPLYVISTSDWCPASETVQLVVKPEGGDGGQPDDATVLDAVQPDGGMASDAAGGRVDSLRGRAIFLGVEIVCPAALDALWPVQDRGFGITFAVETQHVRQQPRRVLLCQHDQGRAVDGARHSWGVGLKLPTPTPGTTGETDPLPPGVRLLPFVIVAKAP